MVIVLLQRDNSQSDESLNGNKTHDLALKLCRHVSLYTTTKGMVIINCYQMVISTLK